MRAPFSAAAKVRLAAPAAALSLKEKACECDAPN